MKKVTDKVNESQRKVENEKIKMQIMECVSDWEVFMIFDSGT